MPKPLPSKLSDLSPRALRENVFFARKDAYDMLAINAGMLVKAQARVANWPSCSAQRELAVRERLQEMRERDVVLAGAVGIFLA